MAKTFSGQQVIKVLVRSFGFIEISTRGSHVRLKRVSGPVTIVPLHRELAQGTLRGVLNLAGINYQDFLKAVKK